MQQYTNEDTTTYSKALSLDGVKIVSQATIIDNLNEAASIQRKRKPILIHNDFEEVPQRFINCLNKNSYVRPHMHVVPNQWELMCLISGEITAIIFDDSGKITNKILMAPNAIKLIEIPPFCYHTFIAHEASAYLEVRNCKYQPEIDRIYSQWSPEEYSDTAIMYHRWLFSAAIASKYGR